MKNCKAVFYLYKNKFNISMYFFVQICFKPVWLENHLDLSSKYKDFFFFLWLKVISGIKGITAENSKMVVKCVFVKARSVLAVEDFPIYG